MTTLSFLLPAFVACLILIGIHTYLGIHVLSRGVIFVDIALAQIAALGMTVAFLMGFEPESQITYFFGLGFTFFGAFFFAFFRDAKIPQEAIIGISFVVSSALAILLADKAPHGSEHLKYILSGNILWVGWPQILKTALIYALLGILHFWVRKKLFLVSTEPELAKQKGMRVKLWDLFFYLSFGLVITSSVQIGGILLVFAFLIIPACGALLFFEDLKRRMLLGWALGLVSSLTGLGASFFYDLPTGPTLVSSLTFFLGVCMVVRKYGRDGPF